MWYAESEYLIVLFFRQKTADEVRISDGSSDVCSSDLVENGYRSSFSGEAGRAMVRTGRGYAQGRRSDARRPGGRRLDRKSAVKGRSVSVRVDPGGRRIFTIKTKRASTHT